MSIRLIISEDKVIKEITAMDARKNFGELLNEVKYLKDSIIIKKANKPIAVLIDVEFFNKIKHMKDKLDSLMIEPIESETEELLERLKEGQ